ncbi:MAG: hypothetical protein DBX67_03385 [Desulfovibrionaceae bacterium]|nr:MAG: hypothetical protein DBX67_03385 [Desulfovibrionaceae bacterium]
MPGALAPFRPLARAVITLLLLGPALAFTCWLVLTCADFLGIIHFGRGLTRPWADFALRVGLGVLLPPALVAGLDERRPWLLRLREACRASLITFAAYAAGFFTVSSLLMHYASSMRVAMVPILLGQIGPLLMCALFYLSYRLVTLMLPLPRPEGPAPAPIRVFIVAGCALALFPIVEALAPLSPLGLPALDPSFYDARALPQDVFLFATLVWLVGRRGLRVFRPVYVGVCILGPLLTVLEPGVYPLPWQIFHLLRTILSLAACVCLYTPPARRWLAA